MDSRIPIFLYKEDDLKAKSAVEKIVSAIDAAIMQDSKTNIITCGKVALTSDEFKAFVDPKRVFKLETK